MGYLNNKDVIVKRYSPLLHREQLLNLELREIDKLEIEGSSHLNIKEELEYIADNKSIELYLVFIHNEIISIFGVMQIPTYLMGHTSPRVFFLTTNRIKELKREVVAHSPLVLKKLLNKYKTMCNFVSTPNTSAIRWIEWLGGKVNQEVKYNLKDNALDFYYFEFKHKEIFNV